MAPRRKDRDAVVFAPTQGLLKVVAVGKTIDTADTGYQLRSEFDKVVDGVSVKYGRRRMVDACNGGTGCSDNESMWMLGLLEKNRMLTAIWEPHVNDVAGLLVDAKALGLNRGYVVVTFEFSVWEAYIDSLKAKEGTSY